MTFCRAVRLVLPLACLVLGAGALKANAQIIEPDPRFSTIDPILVGNASGTLMGGSPAGFDVTMRDVNNAPRPNVVVTIDFAASGMRVYSAQSAGTTVNCAARTISRTTDALGRASFGARVGGYTNLNMVQVFGDGVQIGSIKARSTDLDGLDGKTSLGDLAHLTGNFLNNPGAQETDFDLNGVTGLGDLALLSAELLGQAIGTYCP